MSDKAEASANPRSPSPRDPASDIPVGGVRGHDPDMSDSAKRGAASAVEQARAQAAELAGEAKGRAEGLVEEGKAAGAEHATGFARAIHHAADDLEDSSPDIARHVRAAGDSIKGIAEAMRERSAGQLLADVNDFARRQPTLFFGAAAIAGFALVRFAKSSAEGRTAGSPRMAAPHPAGGQADAPPRPATMAQASLGGAAAYRGSEGAAQGLSTPVVRTGQVPNETSESPL